jgi:predicted membrane-bound spermidine synthase
MGATLPWAVEAASSRIPRLGEAVGRLYGANTLGAALGAILTGYLLMPTFGTVGARWVAMGLNGFAALLAVTWLSKAGPRALPTRLESPPASTARLRDVAVLGWMLTAGFVTFGLEVTYFHLLAVVAGNSTYAFSLMTFSFLLGLAAGSALARWALDRNQPPATLLTLFQIGLGATVLVGAFFWNGVPSYFSSFSGYSLAQLFAARELVRAVVCTAAMLPPALCIGASYPLFLETLSKSHAGTFGEVTGLGASLNTLGNVLGALAGTFLLLPHAGAMRTLCILGGTAAALALASLWLSSRDFRPALGLAALAALSLVLVMPRSFDWDRLANGANVYFTPQPWGHVIASAESADGGLTTVHEAWRNGRRVRTLVTNGKFQGDDVLEGEMSAQVGFTLLPLLHTEHRDRAFIIGLGTGVSARIAQEAGFAHVEVAELSRDIADLASRYFANVNAGVLGRPNVELLVDDGRHALMTGRKRYDFVGIELTSIWFSGAGNLYNREFYSLVRSHLTEQGVLEQWVQLHRISQDDIASIMASMRGIFPRVWVYIAKNQGVIVACANQCSPRPETLEALRNRAEIDWSLRLLGGTPEALLRWQVLDPNGVDRLLASRPAVVSTDENLWLEYSTPRGNVRDYAESIQENVEWLRHFR